MEHFRVFSLKAQLLSLILILLHPQVNGHTVQGSLPSIGTILDILQTFLSPYLRSLAIPTEPTFRTAKETAVEKIIKERIAKLKPFLQDDEKEEEITTKSKDRDNVMLEGEDETTIIEFVTNKKTKIKNHLRNQETPKTNELKGKIDQYKQIRRKIKAALKNEQVSKNTQNLVVNTLDTMMTRIIENRCVWRNIPDNKLSRKRAERTASILTNWTTYYRAFNEKMDAFKQQYLPLRELKPTNPNDPRVELFQFFEEFHELLTHISKDMKELRDYKFNCELTPQQSLREKTKNSLELRKGKTNDIKKPKCKHFKICSEELFKFMNDFYVTLNDTAVTTLNNYASMYVRDANTDDSQEKDNVFDIINNISNVAEEKIVEIFKKKMANFELNDKKDANANIKALRKFIKNTIETTKTSIKDSLQNALKSDDAKMQTVKKDVSDNLDIDMNNLKKDYKSRICTVFSICNGKYAGRRQWEEVNAEFNNRNSVYVKVQVSLDDELKNSIAGPREAVFSNKYKPQVPEKYLIIPKRENPYITKMYRKSLKEEYVKFEKLNVTRTTIKSSATSKINVITLNVTKNNSRAIITTTMTTLLNITGSSLNKSQKIV